MAPHATDAAGTSSYVSGFVGAVGNTPLIKIESLSRETGCTILAKAEHLNPGGSVKDRPARRMVLEAERKGLLVRGEPGVVVEGTGGNTGVGLALVANALGYKTILTMPDNVSTEKIECMKVFGAEVIVCPRVPFSDPTHYYHTAKRLAEEGAKEGSARYFWANQFENIDNFMAHYETTGPEIWQQTGGKVDGFVCASGTGGTMAGISTYLKEQNPSVRVQLIDCPGSGLYNYVSSQCMTASAGDTVTEGIGITRLTANFERAKVDGAYQGTDREAVEMAHYLLRNDGLFVGPSAALNCVGAVKLARELGPGHTVVTVLCDGGDRYRSKVFDHKFLQNKDLVLTHTGPSLSFVL
eukprot:comp18249_c0_seq1/m.19223 comp18249_c0_seq1/g.19223  ORF comp18249_c0_seq1/g.19223 comp18249_c0_seq1/m.19223 type:complete len:354 (-) comp18249_c0_seq1:303-1364(-)